MQSSWTHGMEQQTLWILEQSMYMYALSWNAAIFFLKKKKTQFGKSSIQIPFFLDVEYNCGCTYMEPIIIKFTRRFLSQLLFARLIVTPLLFLNLRHALLYKFNSFLDLEDQKLKWDAGSNNTICLTVFDLLLGSGNKLKLAKILLFVP